METNPRGGYEPKQSQTTIQIIWFAMVMAVVLYGVIAWIVAGPQPPIMRWNEMPVVALLGAGVIMLVAAFLVPSLLLHGRADDVSGMRVAPAYSVPARVQRALIMRFALLESGAIMGLVAAFLGHSVQLYFPLGFLAIVGMLLSFPNDSLIRRLDSQ